MLEAKEKAGIYQMRFAGLFDCAKYGAHGLGLLIYDNQKGAPINSYHGFQRYNKQSNPLNGIKKCSRFGQFHNILAL